MGGQAVYAGLRIDTQAQRGMGWCVESQGRIDARLWDPLDLLYGSLVVVVWVARLRRVRRCNNNSHLARCRVWCRVYRMVGWFRLAGGQGSDGRFNA